MQEYRRNQILLNLARNIFEEQNNLECLVTKIMTEAKELLKCERCAVYLLDLDCGEAVSVLSVCERDFESLRDIPCGIYGVRDSVTENLENDSRN